jgi:membrane fusion protein, multidrug efflux system
MRLRIPGARAAWRAPRQPARSAHRGASETSLEPSDGLRALLSQLPVLILAVVLALGVAGPSSAGADAERGPGVVVAPVVRVRFPLTVEALGNARANEAIEIRPQISEAVVAIRFEEGARVAAGQVLVELEDAEALAGVAAAKAALVDSESQFRRADQLLKTKAVPASQVEQAAARRDADRAALAAAEARLSETIVRAPFAGRVGLRRISLGSLVSPQTVITTLDDTDTIKLDFSVPETVLARLVTGLSIVARSAAWPDERFVGTVTTIDTRVDPVSRSLMVRAALPNPEGHLRAGMFLSVTLLREDVVALVVPEESLVPEQSRQFVWVVDAEERVERRQVEIGRRRPGQVEVLGGLAPGERVIVEGTQKVSPGQVVQIRATRPVAEALP